MQLVRYITGLFVILSVLAPIAEAQVIKGPTYGMLPYEGIFYAREPIYHTENRGVSESYGYSHSYYSDRPYLTNPQYHPRTGWTAQRYSAKIHHYHRPKLYPGVYRTQVIA